MTEARIIDVHCHCTLERFRTAVMDGGTDWHGMTTADGELGNPKNLWDVGQRLETMDALRIDVQCVSPTDVFYQYHQAPDVTERIAQEANDEIAGMVRDHPDRFMGLGTLPMQDPERAVKEMARGMQELGLTGFMIDDHVNGQTYDLDVFDPVWEAAQDLGVFLLIHQFNDTVVGLRTQEYFLLNSIGNLVDRTITFASFIYGGVLDAYPGPHDLPVPRRRLRAVRAGSVGPGVARVAGFAREVAGSAQLVRPPLLLRHGRLHPPRLAVPRRRRRR